MNDSAGYVLNGHANEPQIASVISEFLLESPELLDFIVKRAELQAELTNSQRASKLRKLDAEIIAVEKEFLASRKQAALDQVEREFAGAG